MSAAIDRARPLGAIVIGRAGLDLYPEPDGTKIEVAARFVSDVGGSAGNIAVALARQDVRVALVSAFSEDAVGRYVLQALAGYGVDVSHCRMVGGDYRTSLALAETRASDCEVVIYRNGAADFDVSLADIDDGFLASAAVLIVTGTALAAEPSRSAVLGALALARQAGTFAVLDIDHRPYSWQSPREAGAVYREAASRVDAVVGNEDEFALLSGDALAAGAAEALVNAGRTFVVVKRGERGSLTVATETHFASGVFGVSAVKPFGAGDAFIGGLVAALLGGRSLEDSVTWGSAAAALVVSRRGCASAMPSGGEIAALVAAQGDRAGRQHAHTAV